MRKTTLVRVGLWALVASGVCVIGGCNEHPLKEVEYEGVVNDQVVLEVNPNRDVDILFVIDNSGSMAEEQATLAANFSAFIDVLEAPNVDANYRIAITTTDDGHPWCDGTSPEGGAFVASSCRERLSQFIFGAGTAIEVDRRAEACENLCPEALGDLETTPTAARPGDVPVSRPWLERIDGIANLPDGVDTVSAFQCMGPQGIDGCGFEAPLEAMYKALLHAYTEDEPEWGFVRPGALLAVVFVTDEVDCSMRHEGFAAFDAAGDRSLWTDPDAPAPTSGVCWNAGVACEGDPSGYEDCRPVDRAPDGSLTDGDHAVLHSLSRYVDFLQELENDKKTIDMSSEVLVSVITGVPEGYPHQAIQYKEAADPAFQRDFGIGPGCSSANGTALPPVRLRAFAEAFSDGEDPGLYSICADDYRDALSAIARRMEQKFRPACAPICVADGDFEADGVQPACVLTESAADGSERTVPPCTHAQDDWRLPTDADLCWYAVDGQERHEQCVEEGANVEFRILRRPGAPRPDGSTISATCSLSDQPQLDCPDLSR